MRILLLLSLFLAFAGCTVQPPRPVEENPSLAWEQRQVALQAVSGWHLSGRIAVRTEEESGQGSLDWRQDASRYDIRIAGPLGSGSVRLTGDDQGAVLWLSGEEKVSAANPAQLLYEQLGWWIPVEALRYWVLGLPAPQFPADWALDDYGRLASLQQAGWRIRFLDYEQRGNLELPTRIFVSSQEADVRLVVGRWNLPEPEVTAVLQAQ